MKTDESCGLLHFKTTKFPKTRCIESQWIRYITQEPIDLFDKLLSVDSKFKYLNPLYKTTIVSGEPEWHALSSFATHYVIQSSHLVSQQNGFCFMSSFFICFQNL